MSTSKNSGGGTQCKRRFCLKPGSLNPTFDFTMSGGKCTGGDFSALFQMNGSATNEKGDPKGDIDEGVMNTVGAQLGQMIGNASNAAGAPDGDYVGRQTEEICWEIIVKKDKDGNITGGSVNPQGSFNFDATTAQ